MPDQPLIFRYNERSVLFKMEDEIHPDQLKKLLHLKKKILEKDTKQILEVINTYNSLLIIYDLTINNFYELKNHILELYSGLENSSLGAANIKKIPVCYDEEFALDLDVMVRQTGLNFDEIIHLHSKPDYWVYFIGFLPGFPYLGGMNSSLFCRRKAKPRSKIETGSVGIAGHQTGIYPLSSPGGWQIIGKTPVKLFDIKNSKHPSLLSAGDRLQFEPISKTQFYELEAHPERINI